MRPLLSRAAAHQNAPQTLPASLRGYAQAAAVQDTKPPVAVFGLDGTYASALVGQHQLNYAGRRSLTSIDIVVYCCR